MGRGISEERLAAAVADVVREDRSSSNLTERIDRAMGQRIDHLREEMLAHQQSMQAGDQIDHLAERIELLGQQLVDRSDHHANAEWYADIQRRLDEVQQLAAARQDEPSSLDQMEQGLRSVYQQLISESGKAEPKTDYWRKVDSSLQTVQQQVQELTEQRQTNIEDELRDMREELQAVTQLPTALLDRLERIEQRLEQSLAQPQPAHPSPEPAHISSETGKFDADSELAAVDPADRDMSQEPLPTRR